MLTRNDFANNKSQAANLHRLADPSLVRQLLRQAALQVPPIRRLLEALTNSLQERDEALRQRDEALRQCDEALSLRDEALSLRDKAQRQRDEVMRQPGEGSAHPAFALQELRNHVDEWQAALRPTNNPADWMSEWYLPPRPYIGTAPQRYTNNYQLYLDRGGVMRPQEDIAGFVRDNPYSAFDRARFYFLSLVIDQIARENVGGDMAELGVDKGNTASLLARGAERLGRRIYLLDTFEGFPEQDLIGSEVLHRGEFTDTSLALVQEHIRGDHVRFIKGYFPDTAVQIPDTATFSLVHLDCDLYKPFAAALAYFWPRLMPGGFLIMHDYTTLYWDGVEKAVDEFFATTPESIIPIPDMAGTVVVRKGKQPETPMR